MPDPGGPTWANDIHGTLGYSKGILAELQRIEADILGLSKPSDGLSGLIADVHTIAAALTTANATLTTISEALATANATLSAILNQGTVTVPDVVGVEVVPGPVEPRG